METSELLELIEKDAWLREAVMQARNIETNQMGAQ
jgi:hypothetical protein